uniref:NADH dehydrogenase subunit 1, mitochondrial n=1 Tax=Tanacetum cinerariifolium TaxID=118510 RepID=A0A699L7Q5_TANCI|nr:NADH dehydrogenase subunit 1, mitochondrial [Tanacetum cinerariifolium]
MASMQRRLGPNVVGYYGLLQAFADALKLLLKEYVSPTQANLVLFFLGPVITLIFSLLGSLRSTAQLISYELILSSAILLVILLTGSVAETNRAPFDLAEAESELVSGFMTEHAAVVFVFFFLAEYGVPVDKSPINYIYSNICEKDYKKALKDVEYMIDTGRKLDSDLMYNIAPRVPDIRDERAKHRF